MRNLLLFTWTIPIRDVLEWTTPTDWSLDEMLRADARAAMQIFGEEHGRPFPLEEIFETEVAWDKDGFIVKVFKTEPEPSLIELLDACFSEGELHYILRLALTYYGPKLHPARFALMERLRVFLESNPS